MLPKSSVLMMPPPSGSTKSTVCSMTFAFMSIMRGCSLPSTTTLAGARNGPTSSPMYSIDTWRVLLASERSLRTPLRGEMRSGSDSSYSILKFAGRDPTLRSSTSTTLDAPSATMPKSTKLSSSSSGRGTNACSGISIESSSDSTLIQSW